MHIFFFCSSCATLINSKEIKIKIFTGKDEHLVVKGDTVKPIRNNFYKVKVKRNCDSLPLIVFNNNFSRKATIPSLNSFAYWLNIYPGVHLWTGFLIDKNNPKRYTYPKKIRVTLNQPDNYLTYTPSKRQLTTCSNILKITPLKLNAFYAPAVELSYERKTSPYFSTTVMGSYLLPTSAMNTIYGSNPHAKGYRFALEEKIYFKKTAPAGPYVSFELDHLKRDFNHEERFRSQDIDTAYTPVYHETIGVKRKSYNLNFKAGYQCFVGHISFELYAGLGIRYRDVLRTYPDPTAFLVKDHFGLDSYTKEGKYFTVSIPLNFRIGWAF